MPLDLTSLSLYCPLNEPSGSATIADLALGLSGTWAGGTMATEASPWPGRSAITFPGTQWASFADHATHDSAGARSFHFWAKTTSAAVLGIIAKNDAGFSSGFDLLLDTGALTTVFRPVGLNHVPGVSPFNDGAWHSVGVSVTHSGVAGENATSRYYLDGLLKATSDPAAWTPTTNTDPLYIGARRGAIPFVGALCEMRMYDRVLTAGEFAALAIYDPTAIGVSNPRNNPRINPRENPRINPR
jgi:hypothetical protein